MIAWWINTIEKVFVALPKTNKKSIETLATLQVVVSMARERHFHYEWWSRVLTYPSPLNAFFNILHIEFHLVLKFVPAFNPGTNPHNVGPNFWDQGPIL